jgi:hypothetical protein
MELFWGILFGLIAALVLVWMVGRVIEAQRAWRPHEFTGSEPQLGPDELAEHERRWDRSREEGEP